MERVCKKCLLENMSEADFYTALDQYIGHIDEEIKTEDKEYEKRLNICGECEALLNGMCRICGCFVIVRAAVKTNTCPASYKKW